MAETNKFKGVVYLSDDEYARLQRDGSLTENGVTIQYEPLTTVYITPSTSLTQEDLEGYTYPKSYIDEIDDRVGTLDDEVTGLSGELTTLQGEVTAHDLTITSIEELNKDQETKINSLEKAKSDFELELGGIQRTLTTKQDTLTAGEGIKIENNVISSTGGSGATVILGW